MSDDRQRLATAGNVLVPAILTLEATGYVVVREQPGEADLWRAERPDRVLIAEDPVQLLGLAQILDIRGPGWLPRDEEIESTLARFQIG
jgi:hypothetical protein